MTRRAPRAHVWVENGGMVTGTDDPTVARPLLVEALCDGLDPADAYDEPEGLFPLERARVERGRIVPVGPNTPDAAEGYAWRWSPVREGARGPGITTAVVWMETR